MGRRRGSKEDRWPLTLRAEMSSERSAKGEGHGHCLPTWGRGRAWHSEPVVERMPESLSVEMSSTGSAEGRRDLWVWECVKPLLVREGPV